MNGAGQSLRATTLKGLSRTGAAHIGSSAVNLLSLALAARYLDARAFGTEAAASMLVGIWAIASDLGLGRALVQRREITAAHVTSALWGSALFGGVSVLLLWQTAGLWASFLTPGQSPVEMTSDGVADVLPWMSIGLLFASLGAIPRAMLERRFAFGRLAAIDFVAALAGGATLVVMSAGGYGVWSLVGWFLVRTGILAAGPWFFHPILPRLPSWKGFIELLRIGGPWVGSQLVGYGQQNLDYLFILRFLGVDALGYYSLAYRLVALAQIRLVPVILRVTFPAFSAIQDDPERLRRAFLTTIRFVALLVFPMMAGFGLLAEPGIDLLYGPDFATSAAVLVCLAPGGAARGVSAVTGTIFLSLGRTVTALIWSLGSGVVTALAVWVGVGGGVTGVAVMMSVSGLVLTVASLVLAGSMIQLRLRESLKALGPAGAATVGMMGMVGLLLAAWHTGGWVTPASGVVAAATVVGILSFGLALKAFSPGVWADARGFLRTMKGEGRM